ncbi:30S ribosomal protein THX [Fluviicola sp.]|jgi:ribosomal small subunit protein bTHX|uniref:30S ribosomal protein THX n=1 Tax=Fluviicola sp. TaxID=1917219 RepID=UPI0028183ADD|nr:30S ribosomal protein THX [Fluviicola sp.]MDR0801964.1 30S ribosomal protein THX [Fluviicola sp.]
MGKGDIKTAKGKRVNGSYGNTRKRKKAIATAKPVAAKKEAADATKTAVKKTTAKPAAEKKTVVKKTAAKPAKKSEE